MKFAYRTIASSCIGLAACSAVMAAQTDAELALKRVTLSSSGVAYYEYEARVERDATLRLPVKLEQVNDVLKSLVVYDSKGKVGGISLPGREPLQEQLRQLPFDASEMASMPQLLQALRGAKVRVQTASGLLRGRVMAVEPFMLRTDKTSETKQHRASVMTDAGGLTSFVVEQARNIQFDDAQLRSQMEQALAAMANNRAKDGRTVEIITRGNEARIVRVGYVTSSPIWKTAYRLTVPSADLAQSKAQLQGWAVIENLSGQDWRGVELTLTSGKPVTFQQNLYESYFSQRTSVPIELPNRILPRADSGVVQTERFSAASAFVPTAPAPAPAPAAAPAIRRAPPAAAPAAAPAPAPLFAAASAERRAEPPALASVADLADSQDQGTQVSYQFPLPVSVGNGRSLAIPIIVQEFDAQRMAHYQPQVSQQYPLAGIEINNKSANTLPPGAVTMYEQGKQAASFLGDAQLAVLPSGESRVLAYALNQQISINTSVLNSNTTTRASVERSTLVSESVYRVIHSFSIKNSQTQSQTVMVEIPRYAGYSLNAASGKVLGEAQGRWRVGLPAPASSALSHEVVAEFATPVRQPLQNLSIFQLQEYLRVAKDDSSVQTLRRLIGLQQALAMQVDRLSKAQESLAEQQAEQIRLRDSLNTASKGSELFKRYSDSLNQVENRIVALLTARDEATALRNKADMDLKHFYAQL